ncbi:MAG: (2Fe-2S)-binding protein [Candidatus Omnitrophica bacterium]|nr:(2Fe-2S)-binding protein [Candidatus Omnitrophota bacterium]
MAKLIIENNEYDLADGSPIAPSCQDAGIPFNCNTGMCGSCLIQILAGKENLNELAPEEIDLGLDGDKRLACLCVIQEGTVKITY